MAGTNPQVTGPSLNTAQEKFLAFLLRAPTLSYPGGLYLLQAFRGRSGKEMVARYDVVRSDLIAVSHGSTPEVWPDYCTDISVNHPTNNQYGPLGVYEYGCGRGRLDQG